MIRKLLESFLGALKVVPAAPREEPSFHAQVLAELQAGRIDDGQAVLDAIPTAVAELKRPSALMAFARRVTGSGLPEISGHCRDFSLAQDGAFQAPFLLHRAT